MHLAFFLNGNKATYNKSHKSDYLLRLNNTLPRIYSKETIKTRKRLQVQKSSRQCYS